MDAFNEASVWGDSALGKSTQRIPEHTISPSSLTGSPAGSYDDPYSGYPNDEGYDDNDDKGSDNGEAQLNQLNADASVDAMEDVEFKTPSEIVDLRAPSDVEFKTPSAGKNDDIDEFKIQNELAATMQSIAISGDEEVIETSNAEQPKESTPPTDTDAFTAARLHAKQQELLSSLTEGEDTGLLGSPRAVITEAPGVGEKLFSGRNDEGGPLDVLGMAGEATGSPTRMGTGTVPSQVSSPNRKTLRLRPRRAKILRRKEAIQQKDVKEEQVNDETRQSLEVGSSVDPLSTAQVKLHAAEASAGSAALGGARKQSLIASLDKPLFHLDRKKVLGHETKVGSTAGTNASHPDAKLPSAKFEITVGDPIKVGELANAHIVYTVTTKSASPLFKAPHAEVTRRYRDFLWLYHQMLNNHPGYIIPPPPEKQVYGRFDNTFIENRRIALERMLIKISERPVFQNDADFVLFLQSEEISEEVRERENIIRHSTVSGTSGTNGDEPEEVSATSVTSADSFSLASVINATENGNSGGFFSSLIGLNTPKYVENDSFMLEKQSYVDNLDSQLRSLSKSLDFILEKREELIQTQSELVKLVGNLADVEVNAEITELFTNFQELQSKIEQLLERTNLSQIMTIGATIDEYIRVIGSIRNCFENRFKLCNSVMNLESQQIRKQRQLANVKARYNNQADKVEKYEKELKDLDALITKQVEFRDRFNRTFRSELKRFEFEKVREFKSIIEIYWEGLVESQKELIELWESFDEKCGFE
ncbi:DEKNAAC103875 [Brettanomyces naardenensis]|uniref:DEKNAAC103875 n=1 Tax=Brettanomyces naardenensis TaxID=13370 RepID=A0A448YPI5_BRENA|nr:DEKNAAC103875 [Brettanomyces naardenensis]